MSLRKIHSSAALTKADERHALAVTHAAESDALLLDHVTAAGKSGRRYRCSNVDEKQKHDRQRHQHDRQTDHQPRGEAEVGAEHVGGLLHHDDVRRSADLRADAADARGVRDAEHQRETEAAHQRMIRPHLFAHLQQHRHTDRKHHHGGGGVRDPQTDERRGQHEAEHDATRTHADRRNDGQRDAPMQTPLLHRCSDHHAAEKQKVDRVEILQRDRERTRDAEQRIGNQRDAAGGPERNRLSHPPRRHQHDDGAGPSGG